MATDHGDAVRHPTLFSHLRITSAMQALWTDEVASYDGEFVRSHRLVWPKPEVRPGVDRRRWPEDVRPPAEYAGWFSIGGAGLPDHPRWEAVMRWGVTLEAIRSSVQAAADRTQVGALRLDRRHQCVFRLPSARPTR